MSEEVVGHARGLDGRLRRDERPESVDPRDTSAQRFDDRPPGERYYRHPGDVVGLALWTTATVLLVVFIEVATRTSTGLSDDLGRAATSLPRPARQLVLAFLQLAVLAAPLAVVVMLVWQRRWRRLLIAVTAAASGAAVVFALNALIDLGPTVSGALTGGDWLLPADIPSLPMVGAAIASTTVGKPWMSRPWRRAADRVLLVALVGMAVAGTAGAPALLLAVAAGGAVGTGLLVAIGAPNRRPSPSAVAAALRAGGLDVRGLQLQRAVGGRAQLYQATLGDETTAYVKVYGQDSRDADVLYRGYRRTVLREPGDCRPAASVARDVEHEALMLLLARRSSVRSPELRAIVELPDGSAALAIDDIAGCRLDAFAPGELDIDVLERVWLEVAALHRTGMAHGALRAANVLVTAHGRPVVIDLGAATTSAPSRLQAIDRAELLASLAVVAGVGPTVTAARRVVGDDELAATVPYLQPLALSAATRKQTSKSLLGELRTEIAAATETEPAPLERLVRVRPRTAILVVTLAAAFYVLLPQLADVDESVRALRSADWGWLAGAVALSLLTYGGAAVALAGGVDVRLPLAATMHAQLASSFVNRVTPAKVGGLALNVRFLQKAGVDPAVAVTGIGLNVVAGGIIHILLLVAFFAWAGQDTGTGFSVPAGSTTLVVIAVVLALIGVAMATRWGRRFWQRYVVRFLTRALASVAALARSPGRLAALTGGSLCVTLAYIGALVCAMAAFDAGASFAQVGAVYLGSSLIAAAAPTPGGLGAMEAALVAGFTAVGTDPALAVAGVLSYRLATFWLPILPGWLSFQLLERRGYL